MNTTTAIEEELGARKSPFWTAQIIGWAVFLVFIVGVILLNNQYHWTVIVSSVLNVLIGFSVTAMFRNYIKHQEWATRNLRRLWFPLLTGSLVSALVWTGLTAGTLQVLGPFTADGKAEMSFLSFFVALLNSYFIVILWSLLYFAYHFFEIGQSARIARYQSEAAARDAQLNTLKGQINPHFMFNSLNNIRALMLEDVPRARESVTKLSELLRYSMMHSEDREVTLREELAVVNDFLELCKIQYEHRLNYEIHIEPGTNEVAIPPMMLQILVENSVKHGISSRFEGGTIWIDAKRDESNLFLAVSNTGDWISPQADKKRENSGIGLQNIRRRLQLLYGESAILHLRQEGDRVVARLIIPIRNGKNNSHHR